MSKDEAITIVTGLVPGEDRDAHNRPVVLHSWTATRPVAAFLEGLERDEQPDRSAMKEYVSGFRVTGRSIGRDQREKLAMRAYVAVMGFKARAATHRSGKS